MKHRCYLAFAWIETLFCVQVLAVRMPTPRQGLQRGVLRVGSGFEARIAGQGEEQSCPLVQVLTFL